MSWMQGMGRFWQRLNPNQKLLFGTMAVAFVVLIASLAFWSGKPHLAVLFANLDPADGSAIVHQLRTQQIPYKAADRGRTIPPPCLLYTSPSPRDLPRSRMPSSA